MNIKISSMDTMGFYDSSDNTFTSEVGLVRKLFRMNEQDRDDVLALEFADDGSISLYSQTIGFKDGKLYPETEKILASVKNGVLLEFSTILFDRHFWGENELLFETFVAKAFEQHPNQIAVSHVFEAYRNVCTRNNDRSVYKHYSNDDNILINILRFYNEIENVEKLGGMISVMNSRDFTMKDGKKRNQMLGISKKVAKYLENNKSSYNALTSISNTIDHNDVDYLIDYLDAMSKINDKLNIDNTNSYRDWGRAGNTIILLDTIAEIVDARPNINLRKLLNYLIKQKAFSSVSLDEAGKYGNKYLISTPSAEAELYRDYLMFNPVNEWPQNLYKAHNVAAIEAKAITLDDEGKRKFSEYGSKLNKYKYANNTFTVEAPESYDKFITIGKHFQNCLPVCGELFMSGKCDIYFVYRNECRDIPYCAIELSKAGDIIQAKKVHDADVDDEETLQFIREYLGKRKGMAA